MNSRKNNTGYIPPLNRGYGEPSRSIAQLQADARKMLEDVNTQQRISYEELAHMFSAVAAALVDTNKKLETTNAQLRRIYSSPELIKEATKEHINTLNREIKETNHEAKRMLSHVRDAKGEVEQAAREAVGVGLSRALDGFEKTLKWANVFLVLLIVMTVIIVCVETWFVVEALPVLKPWIIEHGPFILSLVLVAGIAAFATNAKIN